MMLTIEENEYLTRTGRGTPMGDLYRRFWLPVLLVEELPSPDCPPVRVEVAGERLIAFRDSNDRIGFLDRRCPHRHADLFWGRNENDGLRCAYHGWKYDVDGNCLDIPNAPEGDAYKDKIQTFAAYPGEERGGVVWVYMGPRDVKPPLPDFEWSSVPANQRYVRKVFIHGNHLQAMEGDMDSSHVGFLHSRVDGVTSGVLRTGNSALVAADVAPKWHIEDRPYGLLLAAEREVEGGEAAYWRVNQWLMPSFTMIASQPGAPVLIQIRVPVNDEETLLFRVWWHPTRAFTEDELYRARDAGVFFPEMIPGTYLPVENRENDYLIDRALQKAYSYTGIKSITAQDWAVHEDQGGPILDRSMEHLVSSDAAIIAVRKRLADAARALQEGTEPREAQDAEAYRVRPIDMKLGAGVPVLEGAREYLEARAW